MLPIFEQYKVSFEDFKTKQHEILNDSRLIVRIENDLYDWKTGLIKLLSLLIFKQPFEDLKEQEDDLFLDGLEE